jgi:feruloyl esterase
MVPGMDHCGFGEGPDTFDAIGVIEQWVEQRKAPERIKLLLHLKKIR